MYFIFFVVVTIDECDYLIPVVYIAGIKSLININHNKLIKVDLVKHPSVNFC